MEVFLKNSKSKWPTYEEFVNGARIKFSVHLKEFDEDTPVNFLVVANPIWYYENDVDKKEPMGSNTIQMTYSIMDWDKKKALTKKISGVENLNYTVALDENNYKKTIGLCKKIMLGQI